MWLAEVMILWKTHLEVSFVEYGGISTTMFLTFWNEMLFKWIVLLGVIIQFKTIWQIVLFKEHGIQPPLQSISSGSPTHPMCITGEISHLWQPPPPTPRRASQRKSQEKCQGLSKQRWGVNSFLVPPDNCNSSHLSLKGNSTSHSYIIKRHSEKIPLQHSE